MMQTFIKRFLLISLLLPFQAIFADVPTSPTFLEAQDKTQPVYLSNDFREVVCALRKVRWDWTQRFIEFCDSIVENNRVAATYAEAEAIAEECLDLCKQCPELKDIEAAINQYKVHLRNGNANLILIDDDGIPSRNSCCKKFKKGKAFCSLLTRDLRVTGPAVVDNLRDLGSLTVDGVANFNGGLFINGIEITPNAQYAYISSTGLQAVDDGSPILFSAAGTTTSGISHTAGSGIITVNVAGTYAILYSASVNEINAIEVFVDGSALATSLYGSAAANQQNTGMVITPLNAGQTIELRNVSGGGINLPATISGAATVNASITLIRLAQ